MGHYHFYIQEDLGIDYQDAGPWRSYELVTYGDDKEQLLANATIAEIDQDGGELDCYELCEAISDVAVAVEKLIDNELE